MQYQDCSCAPFKATIERVMPPTNDKMKKCKKYMLDGSTDPPKGVDCWKCPKA